MSQVALIYWKRGVTTREEMDDLEAAFARANSLEEDGGGAPESIRGGQDRVIYRRTGAGGPWERVDASAPPVGTFLAAP